MPNEIVKFSTVETLVYIKALICKYIKRQYRKTTNMFLLDLNVAYLYRLNANKTFAVNRDSFKAIIVSRKVWKYTNE